MIFIQAIGGLGNQLFTWNMAHHLVAKFGCSVKVVYPKSGTDRTCELFSVKNECDHRIAVIESNILSNLFSVFDRIFARNKFIGKSLKSILRIQQTDLPSEIIEFGSQQPLFVRGYFQSPEFVKMQLPDYLDELLRTTERFAEKSKFRTPEILNSQMMHIRRGDFISNKDTVGLLSTEYFKEISDGSKEMVIFSDSQSSDEVLSKNFPKAQILGADVVDTWTGLSLMSFSRTLYMSNSTYSWWAGIISFFRGGVAIAPNPWTLTNIYGPNYLKTEGFILKPARFEGKE
jgi:hypothetical protein